MKKPPVWDVAKHRLKGTAWQRLQAVAAEFAGPDKTMRVRFRDRTVVFEFEYAVKWAGAIVGTMRTKETRPKAKDPTHNPFDEAIKIVWDMADSPDGGAKIDVISKKPTHNVPSGNFALSLALAIVKKMGSPRARVQDESALPCKKSIEYPIGRVSLRRTRILTHGVGWYESWGFKSVAEILDGSFKERVSALHKIQMKGLLSAVKEVDAALRKGVVERSKNLVGKVWFRRGARNNAAEPKEQPLSAIQAVMLLQRTSGFLDACQLVGGAEKGTVGDAVLRILEKDCGAYIDFVDMLVPQDDFMVLTKAGGKEMPALPHVDDCLFAWRTFYDSSILWAEFGKKTT
jgi:hypothetical protein